MMYWVGFKADHWGNFSIYDGDGNENGEKEIALDLQNNDCHLQKKNSENLVGKLTEHDFSELFRVVSVENFRDQRNVWKGSPVFPAVGIFQTEICVPFPQSHLFIPFLGFRRSFLVNGTSDLQ